MPVVSKDAELARVTSVQPGRPEGGDVLGGSQSQLGFGRRSGPVRGTFGRPGQHGPAGDHEDQCDQRRPQ